MAPQQRLPPLITGPTYYGLKNVSNAVQFWGAPVLVWPTDGTSGPGGITGGQLYCPGYEGATFAANPFDIVKIDLPSPFRVDRLFSAPGTPGVCEVIVDKKRDLDKKKVPGANGARLTLHGIEPGLVDLRITLWTPDQWFIMRKLWEVLQPQTSAGIPGAFTVSHPVLDIHKITAIQVVSAEGLTMGSVAGTRVFTIKAIEYLPTQKKNVTKDSALKTGYDKASGLDPTSLLPGATQGGIP